MYMELLKKNMYLLLVNYILNLIIFHLNIYIKGICSEKKEIQFENNKYNLMIWDTSSPSERNWITFGFEKVIRKCDGLMIVYNVNDKSSLNKLEWALENINKMNCTNLSKILVGNMCDIKDNRLISEEEGKEFAKKYGMEHFEASAKTGYNIQEIFDCLIKKNINNAKIEIEKEKGKEKVITYILILYLLFSLLNYIF